MKSNVDPCLTELSAAPGGWSHFNCTLGILDSPDRRLLS